MLGKFLNYLNYLQFLKLSPKFNTFPTCVLVMSIFSTKVSQVNVSKLLHLELEVVYLLDGPKIWFFDVIGLIKKLVK